MESPGAVVQPAGEPRALRAAEKSPAREQRRAQLQSPRVWSSSTSSQLNSSPQEFEYGLNVFLDSCFRPAEQPLRNDAQRHVIQAQRGGMRANVPDLVSLHRV